MDGFVGSEPCPFCGKGRIGWKTTAKHTPEKPKLWGYCGGDPDHDVKGCSARIYLYHGPAAERIAAAQAAESSEQENGKLQTGDAEKSNRGRKRKQPEPVEPAAPVEPVEPVEPEPGATFFD